MGVLGGALLGLAVLVAIVFRRRWPRSLLVGVVVALLAGGLAAFLLLSDRVDRCLDRGGRWNYATNQCEGCPDCPPAR